MEKRFYEKPNAKVIAPLLDVFTQSVEIPVEWDDSWNENWDESLFG